MPRRIFRAALVCGLAYLTFTLQSSPSITTSFWVFLVFSAASSIWTDSVVSYIKEMPSLLTSSTSSVSPTQPAQPAQPAQGQELQPNSSPSGGSRLKYWSIGMSIVFSGSALIYMCVSSIAPEIPEANADYSTLPNSTVSTIWYAICLLTALIGPIVQGIGSFSITRRVLDPRREFRTDALFSAWAISFLTVAIGYGVVYQASPA